MPWTLNFRQPQSVPVEIEGVIPEQLAGKTCDEVRAMEVLVGNRKVALGELFTVEGDGRDERMELYGDLSGVHWIGAKMQRGRIDVHGAAGRHVGSEMNGGEIHVEGDAGDWVGAELKGGLIQVRGRAGHLVGAAYRGSRVGMTGGTILIHGNVGNELGHTMRRGLIAVAGDAGDLIGFNMLAGTILVLGDVGIRHGAGMKRGTLALLGPERPARLPTFRYACRFRPIAMTLILRQLRDMGFPIPDRLWDQPLDLYNGDLVSGGRGEMLAV